MVRYPIEEEKEISECCGAEKEYVPGHVTTLCCKCGKPFIPKKEEWEKNADQALEDLKDIQQHLKPHQHNVTEHWEKEFDREFYYWIDTDDELKPIVKSFISSLLQNSTNGGLTRSQYVRMKIAHEEALHTAVEKARKEGYKYGYEASSLAQLEIDVQEEIPIVLHKVEQIREQERQRLLKKAKEYKDKGFELETFIYSGFVPDLEDLITK